LKPLKFPEPAVNNSNNTLLLVHCFVNPDVAEGRGACQETAIDFNIGVYI